MTEAEWLACSDLHRMLTALEERASDRKLRLFTCACCRRIWHLLEDGRSRTAVEVAEQHVDGNADGIALAAARAGAEEVYRADAWPSVEASIYPAREIVTATLAWSVAEATVWGHAHHTAQRASRIDGIIRPEAAADTTGFFWKSTEKVERRVQVGILREIMGNPFRPATVDPAWLTPQAVEVATGIYHERAFGRMSILAKALEDAGCHDGYVLKHCRQPGDHVRGCWLLDTILGKK